MKTALRKILPVLIIVSVLLTLPICFVACNKKDDNKLYVGLECAYSPFNYTQFDDSNGAVPIYNTNYSRSDGYANGYDVMIAKRIAAALNKELVIVKMEWDSLIPAVNAGTVDLIIAGMSPTAERKEAIDFSDSYYISNLVIVVRKDGNFKDATSLNDFAGAKLAAQKDTFHDTALAQQGASFGIQRQTPLADFPALINALNTRAIDGYIAEEPGAIENCASNSDFKYIGLINNQTGFSATEADTAIAVGLKKGNSLRDKINEVLATIPQSERDEMMRTAISLASGENIEA